MTRPEPTIIGNCDSWEFIVGKKARKPRSLAGITSRCRAATGKQFTAYQQVLQKLLNNVWANCGPAVGFVIAIPYRGLMASQYAENAASPAAILTKFAA